MEPALWGLIGTLVGAITSIATTYFQSRHTQTLQKASTQEERAERHRSFQRETLVDLQDTLHKLHRVAARGYFADLKSFRDTGEWASGLWDDELSESHRLHLSQVMLLTSRISNDELRTRVKESTELLTMVALARTKERAESLFSQVNVEGPQVLGRIGNELRLQY